MRLDDLLAGIYSKPLPETHRHCEVSTVSCDSRESQAEGLFVALPGFKFDGRDFIRDAVAKGARVVVKSSAAGPLGNMEGVCILEVEDPRQFLCQVAARFYSHPSSKLKIIGITGTNGKTTVTYLLESMLQKAGQRCSVIGTINHRIAFQVLASKNTTPGIVDNQRYLAQSVAAGAGYCLMEVSSHALDQGRVQGIEFSAGVFTNLTQDHLDYHKDMEAYFQAKSLLFRGLNRQVPAVINSDDAYGQRLKDATGGKVLTYAIDRAADVRAEAIEYCLNGSACRIAFPGGSIEVRTSLIGKHNIYNILAAFTCAYALDLEVKDICAGIGALHHVPGRLEAVGAAKGFFVFIDYAHTEDGLVNVLTALKAVSKEKIILVFGCGGDRDRTKRPRMGAAVCRLADYAIVTSDNPRSEDPGAIIDHIVEGFTKNNYEVCVDRKEAIVRALNMAKKNQIVLIAGKGHEDYQVFKDHTVAFNERQIVEEFACLRSRKS